MCVSNSFSFNNIDDYSKRVYSNEYTKGRRPNFGEFTMSTHTDIDSMLAFSKQVFESAHQAIADMKDGERMQIRHLAQTVGLAVARDPKDVLGFVNHFAHNTSMAYVTRGKNGGIIKGTKPAKIVRAGKRQKKVDSTETLITDTTTVSS